MVARLLAALAAAGDPSGMTGSLSSLLVVVSAALAASEPPNVVVILADDLGYADIGPISALHSTVHLIDTPNLQRLADEGQLWTAFANNAKCTTTRASLLTG